MIHPMYENVKFIYSSFAKKTGNNIVEQDGFVLAASSSSVAFMNALLVDHWEQFESSVFEEKAEFFRKIGNDFLIFLNPNLPKAVVDGFRDYGLEVVNHPFYCADLSKLHTETKSDLVVKEVSNAQELRDYMDVFFEGFEMNTLMKHKESVFSAYLDYGFDSEHLKNYIGYSDGQGGCTATLNLSENLAGFYNVCVLKKHRRKSFAQDTMRHLFKEAKKQGHSKIGCNSSPEGIDFYKNMGFENTLPNLNFFAKSF